MIVNKFAILHASSQTFYSNTPVNTLEEATAQCKKLNDAMKPEHATYMVVEIRDAYAGRMKAEVSNPME